MINTGKAELYSEITPEMIRASTRDEEHFRAVQALGPRSAMSVPMVSRGHVLGVLSLVTGRSGRRFDARDLELAEELARRCGTAMDNARLYRERAYIARTLQESLLPSELPDIPGIEAAARFRPTGEGNDMGGDFYDLFATGDKGWTVVVGDVCGKGPDAAAVTALARYTLRAAAMRDRLPSRGLHMLNEALLRQRSDRRFCTVAYAYLEPVDGHARVGFASGGHPLPLLLRRDGTVETVGAAGTLLGVVPDPTFVDRSLELQQRRRHRLLHRRGDRGPRQRSPGGGPPGAAARRVRWSRCRRHRRAGGERGDPLPGRRAPRRHRGAGVEDGGRRLGLNSTFRMSGSRNNQFRQAILKRRAETGERVSVSVPPARGISPHSAVWRSTP